MKRRRKMILGVILGWLLLWSGSAYCGEEKTPPPPTMPTETIELVDQRTEYTRTLLNPDGSRTLEISSSPLYYSDAMGVLAEVGPAILAVPVGKTMQYQVEKALYQCTFGTVEEGYTFSYKDNSLHIQPLGVEPGVEAEQSELALYYTRPWNNADLVYEVGSDQIKERILLYNRSAANVYQFKLTLPENATVLKVEEGLKIRFEEEDSYFLIPYPFVGDQESETISFTDVSLQYTLLSERELLLVYEISESWLQADERVFPVVLDPTLEMRNDKICAIGFAEDQTIIIDLDMYMPAVNIPYRMDHFYLLENSTELIHEYLYGIPIFPRELKKQILQNVNKDKLYTLETRNGAGLVPIFRTVEGSCLAKIRYYELPFVDITTTNTIAKTPPLLTWSLTNNTQTKYKIVLAKSQQDLENLSSPSRIQSSDKYILDSKETGVMSHTPSLDSLKSFATAKGTTEQGTWYYRVAVYNGGIWGYWSTITSFKLDSKPPIFAEPLSLVAGGVATTLKVSWTAANDQTDPLDPTAGSRSSDLKYSVVCDKSYDPISITSFDVTGLNLNQIYEVKVTVADQAGNNTTVKGVYNTPPEKTGIDHIEFVEDGEGGYYPVIFYWIKQAYAYRISISDAIYELVWLYPSGQNNTVTKQQINVSLQSGQEYTYQVLSANRAAVENKSSPGFSIVFSDPLSIVTPNQAPPKPTLREPRDQDYVIPNENAGGTTGYEVSAKADAVRDYEGDALVYDFILYEDLGEEVASNTPLTEDDSEFVAYCEEQFTAAYEAELEKKIRAEYYTATLETLDSWLNQNSIPKAVMPEEESIANDTGGIDAESVEEPVANDLQDDGAGVEGDEAEPVNPASTGDSPAPRAEEGATEEGDDGDSTPAADSETPTKDASLDHSGEVGTEGTTEPAEGEKPAPESVYIADLYTYEEYQALVYDIQYAYYQQEFLEEFKKEAFAVYSEVNNPRYNELQRITDVSPDGDNILTATFVNIQENVNYAWRVQAREVESGIATLSDPNHFVVDLSGPEEPTFDIVKDKLFWQLFPKYVGRATDQNNLVLTKINYDHEDTVRLTVQVDASSVVELNLSSDYYKFSLSDVIGAHMVKLTAYDSANNSTTTERQIILDKQVPQAVNLQTVQVEPGDHSVTICWQPVVDYPLINGYNNIQYYDIRGSWSLFLFSDKVVSTGSLQFTKSTLDYNQRLDFTIKAVDQAGNVSDVTSITGYSLAQPTTIDEIEQINGVGTHRLRVHLFPVWNADYGLVYGKVENGEVLEKYTIGPCSSPDFDLNVLPHATYRFWARTYNDAGQTLSESELVSMDYTVANVPPTPPATLTVPEYVRSFPLTLTYSAGYDQDHSANAPEPVQYYNRIVSGDETYLDPVMQGQTTATSFDVADLPDGLLYTWQVGVSDGMEKDLNGSPLIIYSEPRTFLVDTGKPIVTLGPEPTSSYQTLDAVYATAYDAVSGLATLTYEWRVPNSEAGAAASGSICTGDQISTLQGEHELLVTATDVAGNTQTASYVYKIDQTAPEIESVAINALAYGGNYLADSSTIAFSIECVEDQSRMTYCQYGFIEQGVNPAEIDRSSLHLEPVLPEQVIPLAEGGYRLATTYYNTNPLDPTKEYYLFVEVMNEVDLSDQACTTSTVRVDLTAPVFTSTAMSGVQEGPGGMYLNQPAGLVLNFAAEDPESGVLPLQYGVRRTGETVPTFYQSVAELQALLADQQLIEDGETVQIVVQAANQLGKRSLYSSEAVIIDRTPPVVTYLRVGTDPTVTANATYYQKKNTGVDVSWKMTDATGIQEYAYCIGTTRGGNEVSLSNPTADDAGWILVNSTVPEQQLEIPAGETPFADGTYYISVRGTDLAGNVQIAGTNPLCINSNLEAEVQVEANPYLTKLDSLGVRLIYSGSRTIAQYRYTLYEEAAGQLQSVQNGEFLTEAPDYSCAVTYSFSQGQHYYLKVETVFADMSPVATGWSPRMLADATAPVLTSLSVPSYSQSSGVSLAWMASDPDYGPTTAEQGLRYEVALGSTYGGHEWVDWTVSPVSHYTFTGLNLTSGEQVYVSLRVTNAAGLSSEMKSGAITIDDSAPAEPVISHLYGLYTANTDQLEFNWDATLISPAFLDHYEVAISTTAVVPETAEWINVSTATSYCYEAALLNGTRYYLGVRAYAKNGRYSEAVSEGVTIDYTRPDLLQVKDGMAFSADTQSLTAELVVYEDVSAIAFINYAVGTRTNPEAIQPFTRVPYDPKNVQLKVYAPLELGETYYFSVIVENEVLLPSDQMSSDGVTIVKADAPVVSHVVPLSVFSANNTALTFAWELDDATLPYQVFRYALVKNTADQPAVWRETGEKQCIVLPGDFTGFGPDVFADGEYYLKVQCINKLGASTGIALSSKVVVDTTRPSGLSVQTLDYTGETYNFTITCATPGGSGVAAYQYAFGSYAGGRDLLDWSAISTTLDHAGDSLLLTFANGQVFYLTARVQNGAGVWSEEVTRGPVLLDRRGPETPVVITPAYSTNWAGLTGVGISAADGETAIDHYRWQMVTAAEKAALVNLTTEALPVMPPVPVWTVENKIFTYQLFADGTYYLGVQVRDQAGNWSTTGYSQAIIVDKTAPELELQAAETELVTNSATAVVGWTTNEPGTISYRLYRIVPGQIDSLIVQDSLQIGVGGSGTIVLTCTNEGTYRVEAEQVDLYGNYCQTRSRQIRHNSQPVVQFDQQVGWLYKGETLSVTAQASDREDGTVQSYSWKLVKNGAEPLTIDDTEGTAHYSRSLTELGSYTLTVTVRDSDDGIGTAMMTFLVTNTQSGSLLMDEIWSETFTVVGDVTVPAGRTLTILPGAQIVFAEGTGLYVEGTLSVNGTATEQVVLKGQLPGAGSWEGVKLPQAAKITGISYVTIQGAQRGLTLVGHNATIQHSTFMQNEVGLHIVGGLPEIRACLFVENEHYGVKEDEGTEPVLLECGFDGNGRADYYDELRTWLTWEELNNLPLNAGNYRFEGGVNP